MPIKGSWLLTGLVIFGCLLIVVFFAALFYAAGDAIRDGLKFRAATRKAGRKLGRAGALIVLGIMIALVFAAGVMAIAMHSTVWIAALAVAGFGVYKAAKYNQHIAAMENLQRQAAKRRHPAGNALDSDALPSVGIQVPIPTQRDGELP